jgi:hypothetical protein
MILIVAIASLAACNQKKEEVNLKDTAYEAFIYAYPLMEQVKTMNGMFEFMGLKPNVTTMSDEFPMDNVGHAHSRTQLNVNDGRNLY